MSYVVLARKYRSRSFKEMVGQGHVVQALSNALSSRRLHHAYLFTGTRGIGKTTVSRILAKALNCVGPDGQGHVTPEPCGVCNACRDIDAGRYVDYTELDAASNRGVEEVQSLLEQAVYKPVVGRYKVFMIDEVHMLSNTAFNAMLKTLEEPPEYLKFVLATTDPQKVPVTVLSRCLQFNLRPMAPDTIGSHLRHVLDSEGISAEPGALKALAKAARGSMRDALSLTDQAIAFGAGQLQTEVVRQMLGSANDSQIHRILEAVVDGSGAQVFEAVEGLRLNARAAAAALEELVESLQRIALIQLAGAQPQEDEAALISIAQRMPPDEVHLLYSLCLNGRNELLLAPDEYAGLAMLLLRMLAFKLPEGVVVRIASAASPSSPPIQSGGAAVAEKKSDPAQTSSLPDVRPAGSLESVPPPLVAPAAEAFLGVTAEVISTEFQPSAAEVPRSSAINLEFISKVTKHLESDNQTLGDAWVERVSDMVQMGAITALTKAFAEQCEWISDGEIWRLRCASSALAQGAAKDRLQAAIAQLGWAKAIEVMVAPTQDSPAQRASAAAAEALQVAEQALMSDADVQLWMREYGARVVPGTLRAM